MWLLAAFASAIIFGIGGFLLKVGSHHRYHGPTMLLGLYLAGSAIFFSALMTSGNFPLSGLVILFSVLIGLGSYYGNTFLVKAYDTGPASLTSPLMSLNILLVMIMSTLIYHEKINNWQYLGVFCMICAVSLLSFNVNTTLIKSRMWVVFVVLAVLFIFMREGGLKIAHENGMNNVSILFYGYVLASVLAIIKLRMSRFVTARQSIGEEEARRQCGQLLIKTRNALGKHRYAFFLGSAIGVFSATGMGLLAFAISRGPASIIVPIFSARNFVAVILFVIFFKEKLSLLQWLAVGLLILGIILISHI